MAHFVRPTQQSATLIPMYVSISKYVVCNKYFKLESNTYPRVPTRGVIINE